ncbi:MAG: HAMP domain-containing protein [Thermodesulfobacteriota bacterium]
MVKKIILSVLLSIVVILGGLGVASYLSIEDSIQRSLASHLELARLNSRYVDQLLEDNLNRLSYIALSGDIDLGDGDWEPEQEALHAVHQYSLFTDRIFFLDNFGHVVLVYPEAGRRSSLFGVQEVRQVLAERRPRVSNVLSLGPEREPVILALVPLIRPDGQMIGVVGGEINPRTFVVTEIIKAIPEGRDTVIELLDRNGLILSSNIPERILTESDHEEFLGSLIAEGRSSVGRCHRCHEGEAPSSRDMLAFVPLTVAPWGVAVRVGEGSVFAPAKRLRAWFLALGGLSLVVALWLVLDISRNLVAPVRSLIAAASRIGGGDLASPVEVSSRDEIATLAQGFDEMRARLAASLERIQQDKLLLEGRVVERTREIEANRRLLARLLMKVITAEEEERQRLAKELHDDTGQNLNAVLMSLDYLKMTLPGQEALKGKIDRLRDQMAATVAGLRQMIDELRPTLLDELGLQPALSWLLERYLSGRGVHYQLEVTGMPAGAGEESGPGLGVQRNLFVFRIVQEAVQNIARYAGATEVHVAAHKGEGCLEVSIEDDGQGFDVETILSRDGQEQEAGVHGLVAMRERVGLLGGRFHICSRPGQGTQIMFLLPDEPPVA